MIARLRRSASRLRMSLPLVAEMVRREVRGRYAGSALGFFWSVLHPLLQLCIYTLVFGYFLKVPLGKEQSLTAFALYLFCGLLPWNGFSESLTRGAGSLFENASLIKNLRFPAKVIQLALVLNALLHQGLGLAILIVAAAWVQGGWHATSLCIAPLLFFQFLFMLGAAWLIAPLTVAFRDLLQLLPVVTMVWMYMTPLFYPEEMVYASNAPVVLQLLFRLNPLRYFVQMSRAMLLENRVPPAADWLAIGAMSAVMFLAGYAYFTRRHAKIADEL